MSEYVTVERLLIEARARLERLSPVEAQAAVQAGAILIDIRSDSQRDQDGTLPGARFIPRNVLEWRLDPSSRHCDPICARRDVTLILMCNEGYQSTLAAAGLRLFGVNATDVVGGFRAWRKTGLPVRRPPRPR